MFFSSSIAF